MIRGIFSGKGGVGKTTATVNLGLAIKKLGPEILVVDGDIRNPNLAIHLGSLNYGKTLQEVLENNGSIFEAIYPHETGLKFIPSNLSLRYLRTDPGKLKELLRTSPYDILIDSPPGLNSESMAILECCDSIFIVTRPFLPDVTDCMKTIEVAREMQKNVEGIIINQRRNKDYELGRKEIEAISNVPVIGEIPWDEDFLRSLKLKTPLLEYKPHSQASIGFYEVASKITGINYAAPRKNHFQKILDRLNSSLKNNR